MDLLHIDWSLVRGESRAWVVHVTEDGAPYDLEGATLVLAVARLGGVEEALCKDNGAHGGITILDEPGGVARIVFAPADTAELPVGRHQVQLHLTDAAGVRTTLAGGTLTLTPEVSCPA